MKWLTFEVIALAQINVDKYSTLQTGDHPHLSPFFLEFTVQAQFSHPEILKVGAGVYPVHPHPTIYIL
jgi:hypothetical protein